MQLRRTTEIKGRDYIVIVGALSTGLSFVGPFQNYKQAQEYIALHLLSLASVVPIDPPKDL